MLPDPRLACRAQSILRRRRRRGGAARRRDAFRWCGRGSYSECRRVSHGRATGGEAGECCGGEGARGARQGRMRRGAARRGMGESASNSANSARTRSKLLSRRGLCLTPLRDQQGRRSPGSIAIIGQSVGQTGAKLVVKVDERGHVPASRPGDISRPCGSCSVSSRIGGQTSGQNRADRAR